MYVNGHMARALYGVHMQQNAPLPAQVPDAGDRLQSAHLVIGQHDGGQRRIRTNGLENVQHRHPAVPIHGQDGELDSALPFHGVQGVQHGGMLHRGGDHVAAPLPAGGDGPPQQEVVPLAAAGGEDDLIFVSIDAPSHLDPGLLKRLSGRPGVAVEGGRVPLLPLQ